MSPLLNNVLHSNLSPQSKVLHNMIADIRSSIGMLKSLNNLKLIQKILKSLFIKCLLPIPPKAIMTSNQILLHKLLAFLCEILQDFYVFM